MKFCGALAMSLFTAPVFAAEPVRLCNYSTDAAGVVMSEVVLADDRVRVGIAYEGGGGELITLHEPGRFAQTWARLGPVLSNLATATEAGLDQPHDAIEVRLADGRHMRWTGTGRNNPVADAMAQFDMGEDRVFFDHTLTQVGTTHPIFTDPCGDWP